MKEKNKPHNYLDFLVENKKAFPEHLQEKIESMRYQSEETSKINKKLSHIQKVLTLLSRIEDELGYIVYKEDLFQRRIQPPLRSLRNSLSEIKETYKKTNKSENRFLYEKVIDFVGDNNHLVLTNFFIPKIVEALGYKQIPNIIKDKQGEMQIDLLCVKENILNRLQDRRLDRKEVLAVECKNKVKPEDIIEFRRKCTKLEAKFNEESKIWGHKMSFKSWMVACFGWDNDLKTLAQSNDMKPVDPLTLKTLLKENGIYDPHAPLCPG